jgi:hypothetical protein
LDRVAVLESDGIQFFMTFLSAIDEISSGAFDFLRWTLRGQETWREFSVVVDGLA